MLDRLWYHVRYKRNAAVCVFGLQRNVENTGYNTI